jgi:hypothetical protein
MRYDQHDPLPLPSSAPREAIESEMDTVFDWQYALEHRNLLSLYEKGKLATWNASDLDWSSADPNLGSASWAPPHSARRPLASGPRRLESQARDAV